MKQTLGQSLGIQEDSVSASLMTEVSVCSVGEIKKRKKSHILKDESLWTE